MGERWLSLRTYLLGCVTSAGNGTITPEFSRECYRLPHTAISSPSTCASRLRATSPGTKQLERSFRSGPWAYPSSYFHHRAKNSCSVKVPIDVCTHDHKLCVARYLCNSGPCGHRPVMRSWAKIRCFELVVKSNFLSFPILNSPDRWALSLRGTRVAVCFPLVQNRKSLNRFIRPVQHVG